MVDNPWELPVDLEVKDLRLVRSVIDCGGLSRAAELLHLTPSALSHRLADLEKRARTALFDRVGRRLVPTPAGERLAEEAQELIARFSELERSVRETGSLRRAVVRLATECYTSYHWLPQVLADLESQQPAIEIRLVLEATRRAIPALLSGEIDLAIATDPARNPRLAMHRLFEDHLVAIVSPRHAWARRAFVRASDFADQTLLRYAIPRQQSSFHTEILGPAGVEPRREELVELTEALIELAKAGRGVAVLASWAIAPRLEHGDVIAIPVRERAARRRWCAVTIRRRRQDAALEAIVRALRAAQTPAVTGDRPTRRKSSPAS